MSNKGQGYCALHDSYYVLNCEFCAKERPFVAYAQKMEAKATGPVEPSEPAATGMKFDGDKDEPGLLLSGCHLAIAGVIKVLGFGFRKYKQRNGWRTVPEAGRRYKDALHRHLAAIERGELYDTEDGGSGYPHIDHVACNAMFLSQMFHEAAQTPPGPKQP